MGHYLKMKLHRNSLILAEYYGVFLKVHIVLSNLFVCMVLCWVAVSSNWSM